TASVRGNPEDRSAGLLGAFPAVAAGGLGSLPRGKDLPVGTTTPAISATMRIASGNPTPLSFMTRVAASPCSPQPQHLHFERSGSTPRLGFLSSWNGQSHHNRRPRSPRRPGGGPSKAVATRVRSTRSRTSDQSILPFAEPIDAFPLEELAVIAVISA